MISEGATTPSKRNRRIAVSSDRSGAENLRQLSVDSSVLSSPRVEGVPVSDDVRSDLAPWMQFVGATVDTEIPAGSVRIVY